MADKCARMGCGQPREANVHVKPAPNGCFAKPQVCAKVHKHHDFELPKLPGVK